MFLPIGGFVTLLDVICAFPTFEVVKIPQL